MALCDTALTATSGALLYAERKTGQNKAEFKVILCALDIFDTAIA